MSTTLTKKTSSTFEEYDAAPGLSNSGMRDLSVSPLRYWYRWVNPDRVPDEPTPEMRFGQALHCAVLEPDIFDARYAREISAEDIPDCLITMDDLRTWLQSKGLSSTAKRKAELVERALAHDPNAPILDVLTERHAATHAGKTMLGSADWQRLARAATILRDEPKLIEILDSEGSSEAALFAADPDTGIPLKARLDWVAPNCTLDIKTFAQKRGKSIEKSVADAILYEQYYRQAYFYTWLRALNGEPEKDFVMAFVESEEPHETRIRVLRGKRGGNPNLFWMRAQLETRELCRAYKEHMDHFGVDRAWRYAQTIDPLADEELPGLSF